jgi:hypothetical protein
MSGNSVEIETELKFQSSCSSIDVNYVCLTNKVCTVKVGNNCKSWKKGPTAIWKLGGSLGTLGGKIFNSKRLLVGVCGSA